MDTIQAKNTTASRLQAVVNAAWPYVGGRRGLIVLAVGAVAAGAAMNWSWLVAAGVAPILLAVVPCVAMCALGMCMNKAGDKSCSTGTKSPGDKTDTKGGPDGR